MNKEMSMETAEANARKLGLARSVWLDGDEGKQRDEQVQLALKYGDMTDVSFVEWIQVILSQSVREHHKYGKKRCVDYFLPFS